MKSILSAIKYHLLSRLPQRPYWTLMGRFRAVPAVTSQYTRLEDSMGSGAEVVVALEKLGAISREFAALQIGCGIGRIEAHLKDKLRFCYGIDIAPSMIAKAKAYVPASNVRFICADGLSSLGITGLDLVYAIFVFQHLPRWKTRRYIHEAYAILRPYGKLVFQILIDESGCMPEPTPNHPYGLRYYKRSEVRRLLMDAGFVDIRFLAFPDGELETDETTRCDVFAAATKGELQTSASGRGGP